MRFPCLFSQRPARISSPSRAIRDVISTFAQEEKQEAPPLEPSSARTVQIVGLGP